MLWFARGVSQYVVLSVDGCVVYANYLLTISLTNAGICFTIYFMESGSLQSIDHKSSDVGLSSLTSRIPTGRVRALFEGMCIMRYETHKHTGRSSHKLDSFDTFKEAQASAQVLHNPDWDINGEGIWVIDTEGSQIVFDTAS